MLYLANPALGWEYKEGRKLTPEEWREKLRALHTAVFQHYETQIQGGEAQLVTKMKTFWEYLAPQIDRKSWKAIHKSTTLSKNCIRRNVKNGGREGLRGLSLFSDTGASI